MIAFTKDSPGVVVPPHDAASVRSREKQSQAGPHRHGKVYLSNSKGVKWHTGTSAMEKVKKLPVTSPVSLGHRSPLLRALADAQDLARFDAHAFKPSGNGRVRVHHGRC